MSKPLFSYADHIEAGKTLKIIIAELQTLTCKIKNQYPLASKVAKCAEAACNKVDLLRSELDNRVCEECETEECEPQTVYYGN
jgi:hypothetical protein